MSAKFLDSVVNAVKRRVVIILFVNKHERQVYGRGLVNPEEEGKKSGGSRGSNSYRDTRSGKSRKDAGGTPTGRFLLASKIFERSAIVRGESMLAVALSQYKRSGGRRRG